MSNPFQVKTAAEIFGSDSDSDGETDALLNQVQARSRLQKKRPRVDSSSEEDELSRAERKKKKIEKRANKAKKKAEKATKKGSARSKSMKEQMQRKKAEREKRKAENPGGDISGDSYESDGDVQRLKEDDDFLDNDDDDEDLLREYNNDSQNFDDERGYEKKKKKSGKKKKSSDGDDGGNAPSSSKHAALNGALEKLKKTRVVARSAEVKERDTQDFLDSMVEAFEKDEESRQSGRPGIEKLKMLPKVVEFMAKKDLQRVLLDYNLLRNVKDWIEPMKDPSSKGTILGNLTIREQLLEAVSNLTGEVSHEPSVSRNPSAVVGGGGGGSPSLNNKVIPTPQKLQK